MARKIPLQELEIEIEKELAEYSQEVTDNLKKEIKAVAKESVARLKQTSPRKTGEYAEGWSSRVEYESGEDIRVRIYNRKKPQLTHLLEKGHAKQNGGRVDGRPHIGPVVAEAEKKIDAKVKVVVKG